MRPGDGKEDATLTLEELMPRPMDKHKEKREAERLDGVK